MREETSAELNRQMQRQSQYGESGVTAEPGVGVTLIAGSPNPDSRDT
jgi:hypothetical protein